MKVCISIIHLGRYRIEMLDDDNQVVNGTDGGSALIISMLADWIFKPEAAQYQRDQQANSRAIGDAIIADMLANPHKYLPEK